MCAFACQVECDIDFSAKTLTVKYQDGIIEEKVMFKDIHVTLYSNSL